MVSSFGGLASCSGRRSGGRIHLLCAPRELCVAASASARLGELGCAIEIAEEQKHGTLQNLVGLLDDCSQELAVNV